MTNPLLSLFDTPYGLPPFGVVQPEHFVPAFEAGMASHRAEIDAIAGQSAAPSFENTIVALEKSGRLLDQVNAVFWNLAGTDSTPELQEIERGMGPRYPAIPPRSLPTSRCSAVSTRCSSSAPTLA